MIKRYIRKFRFITIFILCMSISFSSSATTIEEIAQKQKDAEKELEETQKQLEDANDEIDELSDLRKGITDEIQQIDDDLVEVIASLGILEDEIKDIEAQIEVKKDELAKAEENLQVQYESMKARIKYMYEKGNVSYVQIVMESKSMGDLVNKADYIEDLYEYDRQKLQEYADAKEAVENAKLALEETQDELETTHYEMTLEQQELDNMLAEKQAEADDYDLQIARAKQDAAAYKAQIKQQNSQIRKLEEEKRRAEEEKKAEEARRKAEEEAAKTNGNADDESDEDDESNNDSSDKDESDKDEKPKEENKTPSGNTGSALGRDIANYACKFIGNPYVAGGTSLTNGADCSGFTMTVYHDFGYSIPRSSTAQRSAGKGVTYAEAQPGDIICYAGHVGIYIGNGQIVHASTPSSGIKIGSATYREILAVRRII